MQNDRRQGVRRDRLAVEAPVSTLATRLRGGLKRHTQVDATPRPPVRSGTPMLRSPILAAAALSLGAAILGVVPGPGAATASAQTASARPRLHGRAFRLKVDSSPQQATVFWDAGDKPDPKTFGVAGYTPVTIKVPKGPIKVIVEFAGFKPEERTLDVRKSQSLVVTLDRAPQMARLDLQASPDGGGAGAEVFIDGADRGTAPNSFELPAGRHQVEVRKAGFKSFSDWFDWPKGNGGPATCRWSGPRPPPAPCW